MSSGGVVWITGLPSSGKSTLAERLVSGLKQRGRAALLLDGDEVRDCIEPKLGYSASERAAFYRTLANLSALLARQAQEVVVAATAHRAEYRQYARELVPRYVEVFVDVAPEECARRDAKGLYAASARAAVHHLPGVGDAYERPTTPDVVALGGLDERALESTFSLLLNPTD